MFMEFKKQLLTKNFFQRSSIEVAKDLLGKILVCEQNGILLSGRIIETEAYGGEADGASHAIHGKTERNSAIYETVGYSYVYISYGIHHCLGIVARAKNEKAGAVLVRSIKPISGLEHMIRRRNKKSKEKAKVKLKDLVNGPGKITEALGINIKHNKIDLTKKGALYIISDSELTYSFQTATRIGITKNAKAMWRFIAKF